MVAAGWSGGFWFPFFGGWVIHFSSAQILCGRPIDLIPVAHFFVLASLVVSVRALCLAPRQRPGKLPFVSFFSPPPFWQLDPSLQKHCWQFPKSSGVFSSKSFQFLELLSNVTFSLSHKGSMEHAAIFRGFWVEWSAHSEGFT